MHLEGRGDALLGVDVDLGEHEAPGVLRRERLENRRERLAGPAPRSPQVQYNGHRGALLDDRLGEGLLGDIDDDARGRTGHRGLPALLGLALTRERSKVDSTAQRK